MVAIAKKLPAVLPLVVPIAAYFLVPSLLLRMTVTAQQQPQPSPTPSSNTTVVRNSTTTPTTTSAVPSIAPSMLKNTTVTGTSSASPTTITLLPPPSPTLTTTTTTTPSDTHTPTGGTENATTTPTRIVLEGLSVTINNMQITFTGIGSIASSDLLQFQAIMEIWFESYFNEPIVVAEQRNSQRYLSIQQQQQQQQSYRVPEVRNMDTSYTVKYQNTTTTSIYNQSNVVTMSQLLSYDITTSSSMTSKLEKPEYYAVLPFTNDTYKEVLLQQLISSIESLMELSAISLPVILMEPVVVNEEQTLSNGAIAGIVLAATFILLLMLFMGYWIGKQRSRNTVGSNGMESEKHPTGTIHEHHNTNIPSTVLNTFSTTSPNEVQPPQSLPIAVTNEEPTQRRGVDPPALTRITTTRDTEDLHHHDLHYKDQTRTVIGPIVEAIPDPKQQENNNNNCCSSSNSMIPVASLVAI